MKKIYERQGGNVSKNLNQDELYVIRDNIKRLKKENHIKNNEELAKKAGLSIETIRNIGRKKNTDHLPSYSTLLRLADALGVTFEALLTANSIKIVDDQRIAKLAVQETIIQESISNSSYQKQFEVALYENTYDDILAFINYLQFIGYELSFIPTNARPNNCMKEKVKKDTRKKQLDSTKQLENLKNELEQLNNSIIEKQLQLDALSCLDEKYGDIQCEIDDLNYRYQQLSVEIQSLDDYVNKVTTKYEKNEYKTELGMSQIITELNKLGSLSSDAQREIQFKNLALNVSIEFYLFDTPKLVPLKDFYNLCLDFNHKIHSSLKSL